MRSPLWFVVAGLIALAGFAGALFYLMPRLGAADSRMIRVVVPGSIVLTLDKAGRFTIYHEKKSTVDGRYYASESVNGLRLRLTNEATGAPVTLTEPPWPPTTRSATGPARRSTPSRSTARAATGWRRPGRGPQRAQGGAGHRAGHAGRDVQPDLRHDSDALLPALGVAGAIVLVVLWRRSKAVAPRPAPMV
jgi:hypothetical protein